MRLREIGLITVFALLASLAAAAQAPARPSAHPAPAGKHPAAISPGNNQSLACSIADGFTLAAVGDLILEKPESQLAWPRFQAAINLLRHADAGFGNFEGSAFRMSRFHGYPAAENGGAWLIDSPSVPGDLKNLGIELVSRANNHAADWGFAGMRATDRLLDRAGVVHAGTGPSLGAALAPHYLSTPEGRVGLVSIASSFTPLSRAMNALGAAPARPGLAALRITTWMTLPGPLFDQLAHVHADIVAKLPAAERAEMPKKQKPGRLNFFGRNFRRGSRFGQHSKMNLADLKGFLMAVRQAKEDADFVIATIHAHDPGNWSDRPPDFLPRLAHDAINAGADEFIGHGPHQLRGIEIYRGKPIFYSLGNFFFQSSLPAPVGVDEYAIWKLNPSTTTDEEQNAALDKKWFTGRRWYESVVAVSRFEHGRVAEIRLYPVTLGAMRRAADRGIPHLAHHAEAIRILQRLQRLSAQFHTVIAIEGNVGVIRPSTAAPAGATANSGSP